MRKIPTEEYLLGLSGPSIVDISCDALGIDKVKF